MLPARLKSNAGCFFIISGEQRIGKSPFYKYINSAELIDDLFKTAEIDESIIWNILLDDRADKIRRVFAAAAWVMEFSIKKTFVDFTLGAAWICDKQISRQGHQRRLAG